MGRFILINQYRPHSFKKLIPPHKMARDDIIILNNLIKTLPLRPLHAGKRNRDSQR